MTDKDKHVCTDCHYYDGEGLIPRLDKGCVLFGKDRSDHMENGGTMTCHRVAKLGFTLPAPLLQLQRGT